MKTFLATLPDDALEPFMTLDFVLVNRNSISLILFRFLSWWALTRCRYIAQIDCNGDMYYGKSFYFLLRNGDPSLKVFLSCCDSSEDISDACGLWRRVLWVKMGSRRPVSSNTSVGVIFKCIVSAYTSCSGDVTHRHSAAPGIDRQALNLGRQGSCLPLVHWTHDE